MSTRIQAISSQVTGKTQPTNPLSAVTASHLPAASGPFSHAVAVSASSKLLFVSGQLSRDPKTGQFVHAKDVVKQTEQVLRNLEDVLRAGGSDLQHVAKCTVFLDDIANFSKVNEVYAKFFNGPVKPSRSCFAVKDLPLGAKVEVECIAVVP